MNEKHSFFKNHFSFDSNINFTSLNATLHCAKWSDDDYEAFELFHFWLCSVGILSVSVIGILLNVIGICLLSRRISSYNIFNELIIILLLMDSLYLLSQSSIIVIYSFFTNEFLSDIVAPVFIRPISHLFLTLSIFMVLGVAYERSAAVTSPITHRQSMMSAKFRSIALLKYISTILLLSICFNIPKFLERELHWKTPKQASHINRTKER